MTVVPTQINIAAQNTRWRMIQWSLLIGSILLTFPGVIFRLWNITADPRLECAIYGLAVVGAAFLLSWAAEIAQHDIPRALALTILALIAVLPEYAVDAYLAWRAAADPAQYGPLALANMTGANRLLIGVAWPMVVFIYWRRARLKTPGSPENGAVSIGRDQGVEVVCLAIATLYSFVIPLKGTLSLVDLFVLVSIFGLYSARVSQSPQEEPDLIGPAKMLGDLPKGQRRGAVVFLFALAAFVIYLVAQQFAESLIHAGTLLGFDKRTLIQWLAPLASEAPEFIITSIFAWRLMADASLGALVSSKINQWTLLVASIPLVYNVASWRLGKSLPTALVLNDVQREDLLLTSAQSLLAVSVLLGLRLSLRGAGLLFGLFVVQFLIPGMIYWMIGLYLMLSVGFTIRHRKQIGLLLHELRWPQGA